MDETMPNEERKPLEPDTGPIANADSPGEFEWTDAELDLERIIEETKNESWGTGAVPGDSTADDSIEEDKPPVPTQEDAFKDDDFRETFGATLDEIFGDESSEPDAQTDSENPEDTNPPEPPTDDNPDDQGTDQPEEEPEDSDPLEKGRPKRKEGYGLWGLPHLAATAIWLLIIIAIGVSTARIVWLCASDVLALGRPPVSTSITIEAGDTIETVAQKLKDAGLINYTDLFVLYANITDAHEKIQPGEYQFNPPNAESQNVIYDYMALVDLMSPHSSGQAIVSDLRIPEGYTCAQIFQLLEDKKICTVAEMENYVAGINPDDPNAPSKLSDYWFLDGVQWGDRYALEGYLFPNTYDFYENDKPQRVIEKMLDSLDANFNDGMKAKLQAMEGYTIREIMIIASMIEKETANELESFTVSSVIYNRLNKPSQYPYLNIDATIVYALGGKSDLTAEDLKVDSPYNTYTNKGLPPGPISNPSQNSIGAALDPDTPVDDNGKRIYYYYYALDPRTNEHHFSRTLEEHNQFLASIKDWEDNG